MADWKKIIGITMIPIGFLGLIFATISALSAYTVMSLISPDPLGDILVLLIELYIIPIAMIVIGLYLVFFRAKKK